MLKGFFANINMKAKNKVKGSQVVVELFTLFLGFMLMLAKNPFNIIRKRINVHGVPILVKIRQELWPLSPNIPICMSLVVRCRTAPYKYSLLSLHMKTKVGFMSFHSELCLYDNNYRTTFCGILDFEAQLWKKNKKIVPSNFDLIFNKILSLRPKNPQNTTFS